MGSTGIGKKLGRIAAVIATLATGSAAFASGAQATAWNILATNGNLSSGSITALSSSGTDLGSATLQALPGEIAVTPSGAAAFVADGFSKVTQVSLTPSLQTGATTNPDSGNGATDMVITPDGHTLYAELADGSLVSAPTSTGTFSSVASGSGQGGDLAISPDGNTLWQSLNTTSGGSTNAKLVPWNISGSPTQVGSGIDLGAHVDIPALAFSPDGATLYVAEYSSSSGTTLNQLQIIDSAGTPASASLDGSTITLANPPSSLQISPDGSKLYVLETPSSGGAEIQVISTATKTVTNSYPYAGVGAGFGQDAMAIAPDGSALYLTNGSTSDNGDGVDNVVAVPLSSGLPTTPLQPLSIGGDNSHTIGGVAVTGGSIAPSPVASLSTHSLTFATTLPGTTSPPQTVTVTNTGGSPLHISSASISGPNANAFSLSSDACSGTAVAVGASCQVAVTFSGSTAPEFATLAINDNAGDTPQTVSLTGQAPAVSLSPPSLSFSATPTTAYSQPKPSAPQVLTISDTGSVPLEIGTVSATTSQSGDSFALSADGCSGQTVPAGGSCQVTVTFAPPTVGRYHGAITIADNDGQQTVSLSGYTPSPAVATYPSGGLTFPLEPRGRSASEIVTVTDSGDAPLHVSSAGLANVYPRGSLGLSGDDCSGTVVAPGASCQVTIILPAQYQTGRYDADLVIHDDADAIGPVTNGVQVLHAVAQVEPSFGGVFWSGPNLDPGTGDIPAGQVPTVNLFQSFSFSVPDTIPKTDNPNATRLFFDIGGVEAPSIKTQLPGYQLSAVLFAAHYGPSGALDALSDPIQGPVACSEIDCASVFSTPASGTSAQADRGGTAHAMPAQTPANSGDCSTNLPFDNSYYTDKNGNLQPLPPGYYVDPNGQLAPIPHGSTLAPNGQLNPPGYYTGSDGHVYPIPQGYVVGPDGNLFYPQVDEYGQPGLGSPSLGPPAPNALTKVTLEPNTYGGVTILMHYGDGDTRGFDIGQAQIPEWAKLVNTTAESVPYGSNGEYVDAVNEVALANSSIDITNISVGANPFVGPYNGVLGGLNGVLTGASAPNKNAAAQGYTSAAINFISGGFGGKFHGAGAWAFSEYSWVVNQLVKSPTSTTIASPVPGPSTWCRSRNVSGPMYVDPSGTVRTPAHVPVAGATVTLKRAPRRHGKLGKVPRGSAIMAPANRANPDRTNALGEFGWDVLPGFYRITASHPGCTGINGNPLVRSRLLPVPPAQTGVSLVLRCPHLRRIAASLRFRALRLPGRFGGYLLIATIGVPRGRAAPAGSITFSDGRRTLGRAPIDPVAHRAIISLPDQRHPLRSLVARYSGDGRYSPSRRTSRVRKA